MHSLELGLLDKLPAKVQDGEEKDHHVSVFMLVINSIHWLREHTQSARSRKEKKKRPRKSDLRKQEIRHVPVVVEEDRVSANEGHDKGSNQTIVGCKRLEDTSVRECPSIKPLHLARLVEAKESEAHDAEVDELRRSDQTDEPVEHLGGVLPELEEGKHSEDKDNADAVVGYTGLVALGENFGSFPFKSKAVERSGGAVHIRVAGRECRGKNHGIDNVG